jgi:ABC-2 type transport system ATP-binding protein
VATAVAVQGVSKRFRLYHEKYTSLKERIIHLGNVPYEEFWALKGVDIDIAQGETVGLLGHNGSGKSTLLKCIASILRPTEGRILVRGKLAAMLELGSGFHPELSGRDNVFLNASLLGLPRRDVERRFDDIVAFAELEQFIDNQVRFYSSGMYTRLGFAVATAFEPEVLLVDEVLAVGDEAFQRKCLARIKEFQDQGRTIIIVSHAPDSLRSICNRGFVLDRGKVIGEGPIGEAIRVFRDSLRGAAPEEVPAPDNEAPAAVQPGSVVKITGVEIEHPGTGSRPYLCPGEPLEVRVSYQAHRRVEDAVFTIAIHDAEGKLVYGCTSQLLGADLGPLGGRGQAVFSFESVPLLDGAYALTLGVGSSAGDVYDWREQQDRFAVVNPGKVTGSVALPVRVELRPFGALSGAGAHGGLKEAAGGH